MLTAIDKERLEVFEMAWRCGNPGALFAAFEVCCKAEVALPEWVSGGVDLFLFGASRGELPRARFLEFERDMRHFNRYSAVEYARSYIGPLDKKRAKRREQRIVDRVVQGLRFTPVVGAPSGAVYRTAAGLLAGLGRPDNVSDQTVKRSYLLVREKSKSEPWRYVWPPSWGDTWPNPKFPIVRWWRWFG